MLAGLEHMHTLTDGAGRSLAAIHYDVKPENVLVHEGVHDNALGLQFKVSDLGVTRYTSTLRQRRAEDPGHVVVRAVRPMNFQAFRASSHYICWRGWAGSVCQNHENLWLVVGEECADFHSILLLVMD